MMTWTAWIITGAQTKADRLESRRSAEVQDVKSRSNRRETIRHRFAAGFCGAVQDTGEVRPYLPRCRIGPGACQFCGGRAVAVRYAFQPTLSALSD